MQHESSAIAIKAAATGGGAAAAYFGVSLEGLVVMFAAALVGAIASLHWRPPAAGSTVIRVLLQVFALAVAAALTAALIPFVTDSKWGDLPGGLVAGVLGLFVGALYEPVAAKLGRLVDKMKEGG